MVALVLKKLRNCEALGPFSAASVFSPLMLFAQEQPALVIILIDCV